MNDTLEKIHLGLSGIILLVLLVMVYVARGVEAELRKSQTAIHTQMGVLERKLDTVTVAPPLKRR